MIISVIEELKVQKVATVSGLVMTTALGLLKGLEDVYSCRKTRLKYQMWMIP